MQRNSAFCRTSMEILGNLIKIGEHRDENRLKNATLEIFVVTICKQSEHLFESVRLEGCKKM